MHFFCKCGARVSDTTDEISYKARMIADQDWFDFLDFVSELMEKEADREKMVDEFYLKISEFAGRAIYQCEKCGRIIMEDSEYYLHRFSPEGEPNKRLLNSQKGSVWKGRLYGYWDDEKPDWSEHHGKIYPEVNIEYENLVFDDYEQFEARFREIFKDLKEKNVIKTASLKKNNKKIFDWNEQVDV